MTRNPQQESDLQPHESADERDVRLRLARLLSDAPIPADELIDNLALFLRRKPLSDLLTLDALYRKITHLPGVIMEFGVHRGRNLAALTALRSVYEPYNVHRRIIGFDTFTGFPDVSAVDKKGRSASVGRFAVSDDYPAYLEAVLDAHESGDYLKHVRRTLLIQGDVRETLPSYLERNEQTVIALAYFDLDLYEPSRDVIESIKPYLTIGSILAFDELAHAKWPGETVAIRDTLGLDRIGLRILPNRATTSYLIWPG